MKKVLAILMAMLMLTSAGIALADVDTPITFQGIPWGSSVMDVMDALLDSGIAVVQEAWSGQDFQVLLTDGALLTPEAGECFHYNQDAKMYDVQSKNSKYVSKFEPFYFLQYVPDKTIAGYGIKGIDFSFVQQGDETRLMTVQVRLDWQDTKVAYADLQAKLTSVYGEGKQTTWAGIFDYYIWNGADNSMVMLDGSQNSLKLYYGTNDAEAWLSAAEAGQPTTTIDSSDTSGL